MKTLDIEKINKKFAAIMNSDYVWERAYLDYWKELAGNEAVLAEAIKVVHNKWDVDKKEPRHFASNFIVELILMKPRLVDPKIYKNVVSSIFQYADLARIALNTFASGDKSFLMYALENGRLVLSDTRKSFVLSEAMKLSDVQREGSRQGWFEQIHGNEVYDLRHTVLKNENFNNEAKALINEFYSDTGYVVMLNKMAADISERSEIYKGIEPNMTVEESSDALHISMRGKMGCAANKIRELVDDMNLYISMKELRAPMDMEIKPDPYAREL